MRDLDVLAHLHTLHQAVEVVQDNDGRIGPRGNSGWSLSITRKYSGWSISITRKHNVVALNITRKYSGVALKEVGPRKKGLNKIILATFKVSECDSFYSYLLVSITEGLLQHVHLPPLMHTHQRCSRHNLNERELPHGGQVHCQGRLATPPWSVQKQGLHTGH